MAEGVRRRYGVLGPATSTLKATAPPAIHGNSKHKDAQAQRGEHLSFIRSHDVRELAISKITVGTLRRPSESAARPLPPS